MVTEESREHPESIPKNAKRQHSQPHPVIFAGAEGDHFYVDKKTAQDRCKSGS